MNSEIKSAEVRTDEQPAAADEGYRLVKVKSELITFLEQLGYMHRFCDLYEDEAEEVCYKVECDKGLTELWLSAANIITKKVGREIFSRYFWNIQDEMDELQRFKLEKK